MPTAKQLKRLRAELNTDFEQLSRLEEKNRKAVERIEAGATDELDYAALGYTIHNVYSLIENYALRIAKVFENEIDAATWHKDLIERMQLEIDSVRPALWSWELAQRIDELRRFRHLFRNLYALDLDAERLLLVQKRLPTTVNEFRSAHGAFLEKLEYLIEAMETE